MSPREKKIGCGFGCLSFILFMIIASVFGVEFRFFDQTPPYTSWNSLDEMMDVLGDKYDYPFYLPDSVSDWSFASPRNRLFRDNKQKYDDGYFISFWENKDYRIKETEPFISSPNRITITCQKFPAVYNYSSREHKYSLTEHRELFIRGEPNQVEFYFNVTGKEQSMAGQIVTVFGWSLYANYFYVKDDFEYRIFVNSINLNDSNITSEEETYELFLLHKDAAIDHLGNELIKIAESMR